MSKVSVYEVQFSHRVGGKDSRITGTTHVITTSPARAIELIQAKYDDVAFHQIILRTSSWCQIILDRDAIEAAEIAGQEL